MESFSVDRPALTLTELWWDCEKQNLLTVNGFSGAGSQYEQFRDLCACFARMPEASETHRSREQLRVWFGCDLSPAPETAGAIWHQTADFLLTHPICRKHLPPISQNWLVSTKPMCVYLRYSGQIMQEIGLESLRIQAAHWDEWLESAKAMLIPTKDGKTLCSLTLTADFQPQKPDLYHVERILNGAEPNRNLWQTQLAYFLFAFCHISRIRPLLRTACSADTLCSLIRLISGMTGIPNLIWSPEAPVSDADLCAVSHAVMSGRRSSNEGEVPVQVI